MSGFDGNWVRGAPAAFRAEQQRAYDIELLRAERAQPPPAAPPARTPFAPPGPSFPPGPGESVFVTGTNGPGAKEYGSISQGEGGAPRPDAEPVSFWRTTKGKLLIGLIALIVIAAIVGGVVGGTASSKGGSNASNPSTTTSAASIGRTASRTESFSHPAGGTSDASQPPTRSQPLGGLTTMTSSYSNGAQGPTTETVFSTTSLYSNSGPGPPTTTTTIGTGAGRRHAQGPSTTTGTIPTDNVPRGTFWGPEGFLRGRSVGATVADSSQDKRHPRGVAGAEVDD